MAAPLQKSVNSTKRGDGNRVHMISAMIQTNRQTNNYQEGLVKWLQEETHVQRLWVRILAPHTGWKFFTYICCKYCIVCLKRLKINNIEAEVGQFFKIKLIQKHFSDFVVEDGSFFRRMVMDRASIENQLIHRRRRRQSHLKRSRHYLIYFGS